MSRKNKFAAACLLFFAVVLLGGSKASAADQFLFNILVQDAGGRQLVPVYEEEGAAVRIRPEEAKRTLIVDRSGRTAKIRIRNKSAYYKENYEKVSYKKTVRLSGHVKVKFTVRSRDGKKYSFRLMLRRPVQPKITSVTTTAGTGAFTPGSGNLTVEADVLAEEQMHCLFKVVNGEGKSIYKSTAVKGSGPKFTFYWDGRTTGGTAWAAPGSYRLRMYLKYKEGAKNKTVRKTILLEVAEMKKEEETPQAPQTGDIAAAWPWVMQVTGEKTVDYLAETVCKEILKPEMDEYQRCKAIYKWVVLHFVREGGSIRSSTSPYKYDISSQNALQAIDAYRKQVKKLIKAGRAVVNNKDHTAPGGATKSSSWMRRRRDGLGKQVGDCTEAAAMFEALCRHAGLDCDIIENTLSVSSGLHHYWGVAKVNGKWYYCDPRMENARRSAGARVRYTHLLKGWKVLADQEARYGMIKSQYQDLFKRISATDCPRK